MTLLELIQAAHSKGIEPQQMETVALELGVTVEELADLVARTIAVDYLNGDIPWAFGDKVMNSLYGWAYGPIDIGLSEFAWDVYIAFDEGEYIHKGEPRDLPSDYRTLPLIKQALGVVSA